MKQRELKILGAMLEDVLAWHYGLALSKRSGIASGTVYPDLARLEGAGWLESRWEPGGGADAPRRRVYRLTGLGQRVAVAAGAEIENAPARRRRRLGALLPGLGGA